MDVRTTSTTPAQSRGNNQLLIDRGELRSVLSNLSHELCRPLISLKAGFDLLLGEPAATFTPDQRSHLLTMVTLCNDLLELTRSYLDYAGIVQGSRPLCLGQYTIGALIHEISRQFGPTAAARHIHWEARVETPEASVRTDASRCQQILGNLVSNALKYTPVGGRVHVSGKVEAESWSVTVADSGPGIPAANLPHIFEPFFTTCGTSGGTGLGLAIVRDIMRRHGGSVTAASVPGLGARFTLRFRTPRSQPIAASS